MKTLIQCDTIIDGTGKAAFSGDILISDDRIERIGKLDTEQADQMIYAKDCVVCPGFIDTHTHSDLAILRESAVLPKIYQGVTTEILGQDGIGMAPLPRQYVSQWKKNIGGLEGTADDVSWNYPTTACYMREIEKKHPCLNYGLLIPHGNIRLEAMGFSDSHANEEQLQKMERILRREMESGALGMSTGLVYVPCVYAATEELIRLCKIVREYHGVFVVHQRYESERIIESMQELETIAGESGVHLHISHFKISGKHNAEKCDTLLQMLDKFQQDGIWITFDQYPYEAGSTMLGRIIPPWAHVGGAEMMLKRIQDAATREKICGDMLHDCYSWDNMYHACGPEGIVISSVNKPENQKYVGHSIKEIAGQMSVSPIDAAFRLLVDENNEVGMVNFNGVLDCVKRLVKRPEMNVCTDGLLGGRPHPRVYGSFPKLIREYVYNHRVLTLEEAIFKMTGAPAKAMHFTDRGTLEVGRNADIIIFKKGGFRDESTYENPCKFASGLKMVFVNGKMILRNGAIDTNAYSGIVIRRE